MCILPSKLVRVDGHGNFGLNLNSFDILVKRDRLFAFPGRCIWSSGRMSSSCRSPNHIVCKSNIRIDLFRRGDILNYLWCCISRFWKMVNRLTTANLPTNTLCPSFHLSKCSHSTWVKGAPFLLSPLRLWWRHWHDWTGSDPLAHSPHFASPQCASTPLAGSRTTSPQTRRRAGSIPALKGW